MQNENNKWEIENEIKRSIKEERKKKEMKRKFREEKYKKKRTTKRWTSNNRYERREALN